jgi:hypothetical protein
MMEISKKKFMRIKQSKRARRRRKASTEGQR